MLFLSDKIDESLKKLLLHDIIGTVYNTEQTVFKGKFINYRIEDHIIYIKLKKFDNSITEIWIPYPFGMEDDSTTQFSYVFDYRLKTLADEDFDVLLALQSIAKKRDNKFYNKQLQIKQQ